MIFFFLENVFELRVCFFSLGTLNKCVNTLSAKYMPMLEHILFVFKQVLEEKKISTRIAGLFLLILNFAMPLNKMLIKLIISKL